MADQNGPDYNGNEGKFVQKAEAVKGTKNYRGGAAFGAMKDKKAAYLGGRKILRLLSQDDAVGIRAYIGFGDNGEPQLFVVGVNTQGNDILVADKGVANGENGLILDDVIWCPPWCPDDNDLNQ